MALKGAGYLQLRMGETKSGIARLEKLAELDVEDRMRVRTLVQMARHELRRQELQGYAKLVSI